MFNRFFVYSAEALALAGGGQANVRVNVEADSDFEIYEQASTQISRVARVRLLETSSGRYLSDFSSALGGAFGDGRRPFRLPVAKRLKRASTFMATVTDESGVANQIRLAFIGAKVYRVAPFPRPEYAAREPFTFVVPFVPVATDPDGAGAIGAGGVGIYNVRIQEDADFEIRKLTWSYDLAIPAASDTVATCLLKDEGAGYQFMDRPIPVESLGGAQDVDPNPSAMFPFILRVPQLLRAGSVLSVTINNADAVNALSIRLMLHGAKLYRALTLGG